MGLSTNGASMTLGNVALFIIGGLLLMGLTSMTASLILKRDKTPAYVPPIDKKPEEPKSVIVTNDFFDDDLEIDNDILE